MDENPYVSRLVDDILRDRVDSHRSELTGMNELVESTCLNMEFYSMIGQLTTKIDEKYAPSTFGTSLNQIVESFRKHNFIQICFTIDFDTQRNAFCRRFKKRPLMAKAFLRIAQQCANSSQWISALKFCNFSILFSCVDSTLSRAYFLRAKCSFQLLNYRVAIDDLEEAIRFENLRLNSEILEEMNQYLDSVLIQYAESLQSESFSLKSPIEKYLKGTFTQNQQRIYVNPKLRVRNDPDLGRGVFTDESVQESEILFIERSLLNHLIPNHEFYSCHHCCERFPMLVHNAGDVHESFYPCRDCTNVVFCSPKCRDEAWHLYHEFECSLYGILFNFGVGHLALRLFLISEKRPQVAEDARLLVDNVENTNFLDIFQYVATASVLSRILKTYTSFNSSRAPDLAIAQNILKIISNAQSLEASTLMYSDLFDPSTQSSLFGRTMVGSTLYSFLPILNHSCRPNISISTHNGCWIVVRALKFLPADTELRNCYGCHAGLLSFGEREQILHDQYHFLCDCELCEHRHSHDAVTETMQAVHSPGGSFLQQKLPDICDLSILFADYKALFGSSSVIYLSFLLNTLQQHVRSPQKSLKTTHKIIENIHRLLRVVDPSPGDRVDEFQIMRAFVNRIERSSISPYSSSIQRFSTTDFALKSIENLRISPETKTLKSTMTN